MVQKLVAESNRRRKKSALGNLFGKVKPCLGEESEKKGLKKVLIVD
jgi:hypothetical protein